MLIKWVLKQGSSCGRRLINVDYFLLKRESKGERKRDRRRETEKERER